MAKIFFDTEFIEEPCTIQLISIGMVHEDGRELYLESNEVDLSDVDPWLEKNVLPYLSGDGISNAEIAQKIIEFVGDDPSPNFWAYFADYDWVVFCWLFGRMIDLPAHFPKYCLDFKQTMIEYGIPKTDLPPMTGNAHNALDDARWLRDAFNWAVGRFTT